MLLGGHGVAEWLHYSVFQIVFKNKEETDWRMAACQTGWQKEPKEPRKKKKTTHTQKKFLQNLAGVWC